MSAVDLTEAREAGHRASPWSHPFDVNAILEAALPSIELQVLVADSDARGVRALKTRIEDLEHELKLLRAHTAECPRCQAVEAETAAKRRSDT